MLVSIFSIANKISISKPNANIILIELFLSFFIKFMIFDYQNIILCRISLIVRLLLVRYELWKFLFSAKDKNSCEK